MRGGFDQPTARRFFSEVAEKLLLVDTGVGGNSVELLAEASEYLGMPSDTISVGTCHTRLQIRGIVLTWRYQQEKDLARQQLMKITRESADYSMAFTQISLLAQLSDEKKIMDRIAEMVTLLFAPAKAFFIPESKEVQIPAQELISLPSSSKPNGSEASSFAIHLQANEQALGRIDIIQVSFPQYLPYYQMLAPILGKIFGLVLSNAARYTTIRNHEELLRKNSQELSNLNATKDKFFSIIAHDLRSPFNSLLGFINLFLDEYDEFTDSEKRDFMLRIQSISMNTFRLLENLLDWARTQSGNYEIRPDRISLRKLFLENIGLFEPGASRKNIRLRLDTADDLEVNADSYAIDAVIRNLINNALKFTRQGGEITLNYCETDGKALCTVTDTGIGIPATMLDQLFRIDTKVRRDGTASETGTGLGLILCNEFVELNGGKIWAESEEGNGSTFFFTVPLVDGP